MSDLISKIITEIQAHIIKDDIALFMEKITPDMKGKPKAYNEGLKTALEIIFEKMEEKE